VADFVPIAEPLLDPEDAQRVQECIQSGWISSKGPYLEEFERRWADYCGMRYGIAVSSGTAALQVALACLNLTAGDEVILPSFTIISCVLAVLSQGATPVLVDCDPETWCLDASLVEAASTPRTRAIMPVHIYGHPADMDPLLELAAQHNLTVIEDAAEAHGAEYQSARSSEAAAWRRCGGIGDTSAFSFYANKLVTTGEGGMMLTNRDDYSARARSYRDLGFRSDRRFYHTELGQNFRMTSLQAALGIGQIKRMDRIIARKRWMAQAYRERLHGLDWLQLPAERAWAHSSYWMYGVVLREDTGMDAAGFAQYLRAEGVDARPFFLGMHEQPALHARGLFVGDKHPVTERLSRRGILLPSGLALTEEQIDRVCLAVRQAGSRSRPSGQRH